MKSLFIATFVLFSLPVLAQRDWNRLPMDKMLSADTVQQGGYTLVFLNQDSALDPVVHRKLEQTFFSVYPKEANEYNPNTARKVIFYIDPQYTGVAATSDGIVRFNPQWFHKHPEDIDVVTHEVMHIVQDYGHSKGPGWLTEGIADYVRYEYGVNNPAANWKLSDFKAEQNYTNAYRVTARFLAWLEKNKKPGIVKALDASLRDKTYTADNWKQLTGKNVDELWAEYAANPGL